MRKITEPPVQYTYNLTLSCQLPEAFADKDKQKEVKEIIKHVWINDKGDAKVIALP